MNGLLSGAILIFIVAPLVVTHLTVTIGLAIKRHYRRIDPAVCHTLLGLVAPIAGMAVVVYDLSGPARAHNRDSMLIVLAVVMALALLPLAAHFFQRNAQAWPSGTASESRAE